MSSIFFKNSYVDVFFVHISKYWIYIFRKYISALCMHTYLRLDPYRDIVTSVKLPWLEYLTFSLRRNKCIVELSHCRLSFRNSSLRATDCSLHAQPPSIPSLCSPSLQKQLFNSALLLNFLNPWRRISSSRTASPTLLTYIPIQQVTSPHLRYIKDIHKYLRTDPVA